MDTFVGGVAKKIEKTYFDTFKAEAQEAREKQAVGSTQKIDENAPELRIDGSTFILFAQHQQHCTRPISTAHTMCDPTHAHLSFCLSLALPLQSLPSST